MPTIDTERYDVDPRPIGKGGFGEVFVATDLLFDRKVVIKTIIASQLYGIDEPVYRKQFFKESLIAAKLGLESDYIVKVYDYGYDRTSELPFFVMEFVQGRDLSSDVGVFPWEEAVKVLEHIFRALLVAHQKGVVHSDISPDNIMFDEITGKYKLNDFGLAKLLNSTLMRRGSMKSFTGGKPGFLPPLDWQTGLRNKHSDLYGLAATLMYLLTGRLPMWDFRGGTINPPDVSKLFDTSSPDFDGDAVVVKRFGDLQDELSIFSIPPRKSGIVWKGPTRSWKFTINITRTDIVKLLENIIRGDIASVDQAIEFVKAQTLDRIDPIPPPPTPVGDDQKDKK